jgi:hypothetical protein
VKLQRKSRTEQAAHSIRLVSFEQDNFRKENPRDAMDAERCESRRCNAMGCDAMQWDVYAMRDNAMALWDWKM